MIDPIAREAGRAVRAALKDWPTTARLCILIVVTVAAVSTFA